MAIDTDETTEVLRRLLPLCEGIARDTEQLKTEVTAIKADIKTLTTDVIAIKVKVDLIPTPFQMLVAVTTILFTVFVGAFGLIAATRYLPAP